MRLKTQRFGALLPSRFIVRLQYWAATRRKISGISSGTDVRSPSYGNLRHPLISMEYRCQMVWKPSLYLVGCANIEKDELLVQGVSLHGDVSCSLRCRGGSRLRFSAKL